MREKRGSENWAKLHSLVMLRNRPICKRRVNYWALAAFFSLDPFSVPGVVDFIIMDDLRMIAYVMNNLVLNSEATAAYDAGSDSLVWSDEIPDPGVLKIRQLWCLRPVLRYRTSIVVGSPEKQYQYLWEEALRLFPEWPGFATTRRSTEWASAYYRFKKSSKSDFDRLIN